MPITLGAHQVKTNVTGLSSEALSKVVGNAASKAGEQLVRTATYSISDSIAKWATASIVPLRRDIEKALQPFMKAIQQQVVQSLGSMAAPKITIAAPAAPSIPSQATAGMTQAQFYALPGGQKAPSYKATNISPPGGIGPYAPVTGPGGQGWNPGGPSTGGLPRPSVVPTARPPSAAREEKGESAFGVAMMTEGINSIFEQISEVRNEMYATAVQSSNLQRQLNFAPSRDIRPFMNQMSAPGMELGYTRQESLSAAQTLALSGGRQTQAQVIAANKAMVEFASQRGLQLPDWAGTAAGGEQAGLFGGARGTEGGAEGIEGYQRRLAGAYSIAARPGQGSRGTTLEFQNFAQSINSLTEGLTQITGNSQEVAESFKDIGKSGNLFNLFTRLQQTGNQAVAGQAGVQAITGMAASVTNQIYGTPMQQSMAYAAFPGMNPAQVWKEESQHPGEAMSREISFIKKSQPKDQQEFALHNLFPDLSYGQAHAVLQATGAKGGKSLSDKELQKLGIKPEGPDQAADYRSSMDALTKKMEELATAMSPLLMTFDKLQGVSYGLLGVWMLMQREKFAESLAHVGKLFGFGGGKKGTVAEGVGEAIASKLDCVKICNGSELGQQLGQGLKKEAEAKVEGVAEGEAEQVAKQGLFRRLLGQGSAVFRGSAARIAGGEGIAAVGGDVLGGLGASAAGVGEGALGAAGVGLLGAGELAAGVAASPLLLPAAVVGGGLAAAYGITHPKQAADFIGGVGHFAGQAIGGTVNAAGNVIGGTANALWKTASAITTLAVGKDAADAIGGFGKKLASPFNWAGGGIKSLWHGAEHFGSGAESFVGGLLKHTGFAVNRMVAHGGGLSGLVSSIVNPFQAFNEVNQAVKGWQEADPRHKGVGRGGVSVVHQEMARHVKDSAKIRLDHLTATNQHVEAILKSHLDKNNPLPAQAKSDFLTTEGNFLKGIGDTLKGWFKGTWDTVSGWFNNLVGNKASGKGGDTGGGDTGGQGTGAAATTGSYTPPGGGAGGFVNPFDPGKGWSTGLGWGKDAHVTLAGGIEDFERGQIFGAKAGTPIVLSQGAKYDKSLSDEYRSIFTLPSGQAVSYMHGAMDTKYKEGQYLKAGTQIGKELDISGTYTSKTSGIQYKSYPGAAGMGIVEFGVYDNPQDAYARNVAFGSKSLDPNAYLQQGGYAAPTSTANANIRGGSSYPTSITVNSKSQGKKTLTDPKIIKAMVDASRQTGVPVQVLAAQGFAESTWEANPAQGVPGGGWAQFIPETARHYKLNPNDRTNPLLAIPAEARMMADKMKLQGGSWSSLPDIDAVLSGYYGTDPGSFNNAYQGYSAATPKGGASVVSARGGGVEQSLKVEPIEVTVNLKWPDGSIQKIVQTAKFQGVGGVHVAVPGHGLSSHHANSRVPRK